MGYTTVATIRNSTLVLLIQASIAGGLLGYDEPRLQSTPWTFNLPCNPRDYGANGTTLNELLVGPILPLWGNIQKPGKKHQRKHKGSPKPSGNLYVSPMWPVKHGPRGALIVMWRHTML